MDVNTLKQSIMNISFCSKRLPLVEWQQPLSPQQHRGGQADTHRGCGTVCSMDAMGL
jgi:hypothetical protein